MHGGDVLSTLLYAHGLGAGVDEMDASGPGGDGKPLVRRGIRVRQGDDRRYAGLGEAIQPGSEANLGPRAHLRTVIDAARQQEQPGSLLNRRGNQRVERCQRGITQGAEYGF